MAQTQAQSAPETTAKVSTEGSTLVLNLGSGRRKNVKRLRKGKGPLMHRVNETIDQLRDDNEIAAGSDVVIVIVKQKPKQKRWPF